MKVLRYAILTAACMGLMSCDELEGVLSLQQPVNLIGKKGAAVALPAGSYQAKIGGDSSKIKVKIKTAAGDQKVEFAVPKGTNLNNLNNIDLAPEVSGQPYRIKGSENTDYSQSPSTRTTESCTYYTTERQCGYETTPPVCRDRQVCDGPLVPGQPPGCRMVRECGPSGSVYVCRDVTVSRYGNKEVEYYMSYSTTHRQIQILEPATQAVLGAFNNTSSTSNKNYIYQGTCY